MTTFTKLLAGSAGLAALATAAPAAAQYYGYGYQQPYAYGYTNTSFATQQCTAAVQQRLSSRVGLQGILGAVLGAPTQTGRVLSITRVNPNRTYTRVRGLATSGRAMAYNPYGYGAYGALAYRYQPDLSFKCDVDYRGYVRDVDINRR